MKSTTSVIVSSGLGEGGRGAENEHPVPALRCFGFFSVLIIFLFFLIINYASTCQLMPGHNLIQLVSWAAAAAVAHTLSEPALGRSSCRRCRVPAPLTKGNVLCLGLFSAVSLCVGSIRIVWY